MSANADEVLQRIGKRIITLEADANDADYLLNELYKARHALRDAHRMFAAAVYAANDAHAVLIRPEQLAHDDWTVTRTDTPDGIKFRHVPERDTAINALLPDRSA